jgi:F0F1-type ATP synthase epsilon subunit
VSTNIVHVDRDDAIVLARDAENESAIDKLRHQLTAAREELRICEDNLSALEESLAGTSKK